MAVYIFVRWSVNLPLWLVLLCRSRLTRVCVVLVAQGASRSGRAAAKRPNGSEV